MPKTKLLRSELRLKIKILGPKSSHCLLLHLALFLNNTILNKNDPLRQWISTEDAQEKLPRGFLK